ncbi:MAG: helix-turn-helix domain-containing protein [Ruminococcus sp.]|nr:helix-turn-helix domain-containing protein [Ruminococcus sp.]
MSVYESIIKGLNEAVEYESGQGKARIAKCTVNPAPEFSSQEIKDIRLNFGMTQVTFAEVMGVSVKTVEAWEAGTNKPIGSARRFLSVIKAEPELLAKVNIISA